MSQPADIIITHAQAITSDPANPRAEAVAIRGQRILFVGTTEAALEWRGPATRLIDAQGYTLLPGFIDSHYHLLLGSLELDDAQLAQVTNLAELTTTLVNYAGHRPAGTWLVGSGLRYSILPAPQLLTRHHLDAIISEQPLILFAYDGHTAWANTLALRLANLLHGGEAGPNSEIVMGDDGLATGELREPGAYNPIRELLPIPDEAQKRQLLRQGLAQAAALGVTSIHNMDGNAAQMALYASLLEAGELTLRVYCPYSITPATSIEDLAEAIELQQTYQNPMLRSGCVKFFMDGVVESYTGLLLDDYDGQPGCRGEANYSIEHFTHLAGEADRLGLQIFVHAVGDGAVRRTLDAYETIQQANGRRDSRHRIEHIELIHPDDIPRFADLGIIASMQPLHAPLAPGEADPWPARVGPTRWGCSFAWQSLRHAGARLAFGSDWPVVSQDPILGLSAALNHRPWLPGLPDQRQTLTDTIASYTGDAAYAEFQETEKGQLKAGMLADLVLLSMDLEKIHVEEINQARVVLTMCNGRLVYES